MSAFDIHDIYKKRKIHFNEIFEKSKEKFRNFSSKFFTIRTRGFSFRAGYAGAQCASLITSLVQRAIAI